MSEDHFLLAYRIHYFGNCIWSLLFLCVKKSIEICFSADLNDGLLLIYILIYDFNILHFVTIFYPSR